jgi:hypothetical protein
MNNAPSQFGSSSTFRGFVEVLWEYPTESDACNLPENGDAIPHYPVGVPNSMSSKDLTIPKVANRGQNENAK